MSKEKKFRVVVSDVSGETIYRGVQAKSHREALQKTAHRPQKGSTAVLTRMYRNPKYHHNGQRTQRWRESNGEWVKE